ncbi:hypothetical protein SCP_0200780 [Sparassis crispa]|uniref:Uncharacterized protein n=1 Tax=Sparassis crispa TaxID=139825 RepID=A0A401G9Q0_9APHY|nr:hypothetical protein SCP_0200780 [Sparassis crispa]GBE78881.1 hypothetical protein SCP_0200780 [Sparassis crispa]
MVHRSSSRYLSRRENKKRLCASRDTAWNGEHQTQRKCPSKAPKFCMLLDEGCSAGQDVNVDTGPRSAVSFNNQISR